MTISIIGLAKEQGLFILTFDQTRNKASDNLWPDRAVHLPQEETSRVTRERKQPAQ